jgi:hypothetical protein
VQTSVLDADTLCGTTLALAVVHHGIIFLATLVTNVMHIARAQLVAMDPVMELDLANAINAKKFGWLRTM